MLLLASAVKGLSCLSTCFGSWQLTPPFTSCSILTPFSGPHRSPKPLLGLSVPVSAFQFEKYRRIGNSHGGFDQEDAKFVADTIQLRDDLVMRKGEDFLPLQKSCELFPIGRDTRSILLRDELHFCI